MEYTEKRQLSLFFGLSTILDYLLIFKNFENCFFEIEFSQKTINKYRNEYGDEYYFFLKSFLIDNISEMNNVKLVESNNFKLMVPLELLDSFGRINEKTLSNVKIKTNFICDIDNFVVINTKILTGCDSGIREKWNNEIKNNLFEILNEKNIKVVIIGEKIHNDCEEYKLHNVFSIYQDIINGDLKNLIDLTIDDTISLYKKENIIRNLTLLQKSLFNIHIGEGGGLRIYSHYNNLISFTNKKTEMSNYINNEFFNISTFSSDEFLSLINNNLKNLLC